MNIYYLKKFRKEANRKLKLIKISNNLYYVGRVFGCWGCGDTILQRSNDLPYEEALNRLKELRREYVLWRVYEKRLKRSEIVKNV
jgi:hypothetical protein